MSFIPVSCEDCSFPPNFIVLELKDKVNAPYYSIKCRDCGDCWDEPNENFFENTQTSLYDGNFFENDDDK